MIERLVEANAWARLAEIVWAESLMSGNGEHLLDAIADHPETRPYLEQVQTRLFKVEDGENAPIPEDEGEAAELVGRIRRVAEGLDLGHLNQCDLLTLSRDALRLADIAKARNIRDRDASLQRVQVEEWETRHADTVAGAAMLENFPAALRARIDRGGMDRESVSAALNLAERLLSVDTRYRETHEQLNRASSDEDFASVRSLAETLESLRTERDDLRATIDSTLTNTQPDNPAPEKPWKEDRTESSDSETTASEAHTEKLQTPDGASPTSAPTPKEDISESSAGESIAPDDDGEDGEPAAETTASTAPPDGDEDRPAKQIEDDIAAAISRDRLGLAYHLARVAPDALPSAHTVKLVACNYVTDERAPIDAELPSIAAALLYEAKSDDDRGTDVPHRHDHAILAACAALSPALAAPGGPVAQLLSILEPRLGDVPSLRTMVKNDGRCVDDWCLSSGNVASGGRLSRQVA